MANNITDTVKTSSNSVSCGGDESSSHPEIYLTIAPDKSSVKCPYCSRIFKLSE